MIRDLTEQLKNILAKGYASQIKAQHLPPEEQELANLLNQILADLGREKTKNLSQKANLLTDIDTLAEVLEKIALGNFDVEPRPMKLSAMETMRLGIADMARKIEEYNAQLKKNLEAINQSAREAREAEANCKSKSLFLANMSHEIRTPMNAILGFNRLALEGDLTPDQRHHLLNVQESAEALLVLINDILDLSKIEAAQLDLEEKPFAPRQTIEATVRTLAGKAREKGLRLTYDLAEDFPAMLIGDEYRLRQILLNLAGNGIKFTLTGEVSIKAEVRSQTDQQVGLLFCVRDTGPGIPAEAHDLVFDSFTQVDNSMTRHHGGTGLGLAICKKLTHLLGGEIWLQSECGRGTAFFFSTVFRPAAPLSLPKTEEENAPLAGNPPALGAMHVLMVEDNRFNQELALAILTRQGQRVTIAANGEEALKALARERFDLILMDIQMPVMDGITACRLIRRSEREKEIKTRELHGVMQQVNTILYGTYTPIVAMTAHAMAGDRERCLAAGMDDYITKPFHLEEIAGVLSRFAAPPTDEPS